MELLPGEGVGPLRLGMTLWNTLNLLRSTSARVLGNLTQSAISWSSEEPNSSYIVINISFGPATAYRLVYSGTTQRLELIEVLPPAISCTITWKGQRLFPSDTSGNDSSADGAGFMLDPQRALNAKFGPSYAPSPHPSFPDELVLSYPGIVFAFYKDNAPFRSSALPTSTSKQASDSKTAETKCPLTRLVVSRHDPSANHASAYPDISKLEELQVPYPVAEGDIACADVELSDDALGRSKVTLHLINMPSAPVLEPVEVVLGVTSAEDITCTLGPPLRTYYKEDTRLSIHDRSSSSASGTEVPPNAYFFNYFSLGLDFLFHPETNKVIKVLIHANTPGEVLFGRYSKCSWRLHGRGQSSNVATSEDSIDKVKTIFTSSEKSESAQSARPARQERTMLLDRLADSTDGVKLDRQTDLQAFPGCIMEVTQNKCIETLWIV